MWRQVCNVKINNAMSKILKYFKTDNQFGNFFKSFPLYLKVIVMTNWCSLTKDSKATSGHIFTIGVLIRKSCFILKGSQTSDYIKRGLLLFSKDMTMVSGTPFQMTPRPLLDTFLYYWGTVLWKFKKWTILAQFMMMLEMIPLVIASEKEA